MPRPAFGAIASCLVLPAAAVGLGELSVHSALGEALDATVALEVPPGSSPRPDCFSLGPAPTGGLPDIPRARFATEPTRGGWQVRIRTDAAIAEPAVQLRLEASCEGLGASARTYEILLDPRLARVAVARQTVAAAPAAHKPAPFVLRLSAPQVDLGRSRGIDEGTRAQLRQQLLRLDTDDPVAALLASRHRQEQLEGRVAELQLKLSALPALPALPAPPRASVDAVEMPGWTWAGYALLLAALVAVIGKALARARGIRPRTSSVAAASTASPVPDEARARSERGIGHGLDVDDRDFRLVADSDAALSTGVSGVDPAALRRRYIEERFPEIAGGTIELDDPDSVLKAARLFYEDGALARAVELLQFVREENPVPMKPWLALFEIFRLEGLRGEFAELARRFRDQHRTSRNWRKVQFIGRELDPDNPLYREDPADSLETLGMSGTAGAAVITFDPLAENWLNAPMDFTTDALAGSLRAGVLRDAGLTDADLVADPMPALKNIEIFHVA